MLDPLTPSALKGLIREAGRCVCGLFPELTQDYLDFLYKTSVRLRCPNRCRCVTASTPEDLVRAWREETSPHRMD